MSTHTISNVTGLGAYHLAANPDLYEVARSNNFEFVVTGIDSLLAAGKVEGVAETIVNGQEIIRLSVIESSLPTFTQDVIEIRRGNSVMKAAGLPKFEAGTLKVHDFVGVDTKSVLMAWQNLSYNVATEKIGKMSEYKKDCWLMEYTPNGELIRQWELKGCWINGITMPNYNQESGDKRDITANIVYDYALMSKPDDEAE